MSNPVVTFLQSAGSKLLSFFKADINPIIKDGVGVAQAAEPIVGLALPEISLLFNATVAAVANAEAMGQAAAATGGNGEQKLASVIATLEPLATAYLQQQGITANTAQITAWVNAIVAALNAIPAPAATAGTSTVTTVKVPG